MGVDFGDIPSQLFRQLEFPRVGQRKRLKRANADSLILQNGPRMLSIAAS
jgi:hypothetical protein